MSFSVTILGSGAALPTAHRKPTSQYIFCNERHILIDCGEGTQTQIRKAGIKLQKITHILISHLHGDHYFGLVGLLSTMHLLGRDQGVTIYGPVELEQIVRLQLEVGHAKLGFSLTFVPLNGKEGAAGFNAPGRIALALVEEVLLIPVGIVREVSRPESVSSTIRFNIH